MGDDLRQRTQFLGINRVGSMNNHTRHSLKTFCVTPPCANVFLVVTVWDVYTNGNVLLGLTVWDAHTNRNVFLGLTVWNIHTNGNV